MRSRLYVETSVVSYLTARPGRDVIALAHQELTRDWWSRARLEFDLYASRLVVAEAQLGNPEAAAARLAVHGMDYLVTWNCKHIANARMLRFVMETCRTAEFEPPVICTPEELIEE